MPESTTPQPFGLFLKFWRDVHQLSQEDLAALNDCSTRQISRLENGSSRPSESFVEQLAESLKLGERDRNHLRIAGGFGPRQKPMNLDDPSLNWLKNAMRLTLRNQDPYPSSLIDSMGNLLMVNQSWIGLYKATLPHVDLDKVDNIFDFMFSSNGSSSITTDRDNMLSMLLMALQQEVMLNNSPQKQALLQRLLKMPNTPTNWKQRAAKLEPMSSFQVEILYKGKIHKFYSVNQTIGALGPAAYASEPNLTISTLYPEDENLDLSLLINDELSHPLLFNR